METKNLAFTNKSIKDNLLEELNDRELLYFVLSASEGGESNVNPLVIKQFIKYFL